jgi:putative transposase
MRYPHCQSMATTERPDCTELGYCRFRCRDCQRGFNERTGTPFNRLQYPREIFFTHEAVREWESKLAPPLSGTLRKRRYGSAGTS